VQSFDREVTEVREWRRELHRHPELAFDEVRTSRFVAEKLRSFGLEVTTGIAKTGVVATLRGPAGSTKALALRADMDALPIAEENTFDHRSVAPGIMHACGHDGHTAMLLGAAKRLAARTDLPGSVHFIFQPAEEGEGGGRAMVREGLFERFSAAAVFGMHNWPGLPVGHFAVRAGPMMAASDVFEVVIKGRGAHGAMPDQAVDPIHIGAELVSAAQTVVSRKLSPLEPAVVSVTQFHAGDTWGVIPEQALLRGTARSFTPEASRLIEEQLEQLSRSIAEAHGARAEFSYGRRYPPTINSEAEAALCRKAAEALVGTESVHTDLPPSMGAEDFSFMLGEVPGAYVWLGNGPTEGNCLLHSPHYDFNDEAVHFGVSYWVALVEHFFAE